MCGFFLNFLNFNKCQSVGFPGFRYTSDCVGLSEFVCECQMATREGQADREKGGGAMFGYENDGLSVLSSLCSPRHKTPHLY